MVDTLSNVTYHSEMDKITAINLAGNGAKLARLLGIKRQAIYQWPDVLDQGCADRVIGALLRHGIVTPDQAKSLADGLPKVAA